LDSQLVETAHKVYRLRELLKRDNTHHAIYVSTALHCRQSVLMKVFATAMHDPDLYE
jgi:hypothetical protein